MLKPERDPILRLMNRCAHFTGVQHDVCGAGVAYATVRTLKTETTPFQFACFKNKAGVLTCEKAHFPTHEEAEEEHPNNDAAHQRTMLAFMAAHDDAKTKRFGKGHGGADSVACPVCDKGRIYYSVASVNGHMHARCNTAGCVAWME